VDSNETIDEGAAFGPGGDALDPEEQETVLFGQRHLFHDVDLAAAKRQQAEQRKAARKRERYARSEAPTPDAADTVVSAHPPDAATDPVARRRARVSPPMTERGGVADTWEIEAADEPDAAIEIAPSLDEVPVEDASTAERRVRPAGDMRETEQRLPAEQERGTRQIAERRPSEKVERRRRRTSDLSSSCRMCGKAVHWPRARRFRGRKHSQHGFRCDTCGNVFCGEHVQRISGFWESLFHHGRFRCLLCALGQMAKQAEEVRVRSVRAASERGQRRRSG
jgi:hypothetical protein